MTDLSHVSANAVERLSVQPLPDRSRKTPLRAVEQEPPTAGYNPPAVTLAPAAPVPPERVIVPQKPAAADLINAAFAAIARVLAVRLQLLLSLIGTFVLAMGAMAWQSTAGLLVMIAFASLTLVPLVVLEYIGRPRAPRG